jgi:methionyl-tRNA synthetase
VVRNLLQRLYDKGEIYKADYNGFYSVRAEQFVQEKYKVDGAWPEEYGEVVEITEANYFFKLSNYQDWLIDHIRTHEDFIIPRFRARQVLEFLKEPINDLCISRPKERLAWGIPLPFDEDYVNYVWFDALTNYISAVDPESDSFSDYWPVDYHVIGKDILVPPHAVYWPIMLKACGFEPPGGFLVHGFWTLSGRKLSKSTGEVVDPLALIDEYGADAFRYFVIREMNVGQDSDFSFDQFITRYNSDLANDLGNLVSRLLNMGARYSEGRVPNATVEEEPETVLRGEWESARAAATELYEGFQFHTALDRAFGFVRAINRYAEVRAPWQLAKSESPEDRARLETALATMAESLRLSAALLAPVTPKVSGKIYRLLGLDKPGLWETDLDWSGQLAGNPFGEKTILFPKPEK